MLFLTEGDSAGGTVSRARDARYQAVYPLRGKIANVNEKDRTAIVDNAELYNMVRAQGAFIRDPDIATLVEKAEKEYKIEPLFKSMEVTAAEPKPTAPEPSSDESDLERAIEEIRKTKRASTAHFQRRLGWGCNHAAKILDLLEERGIVAPMAI